MSGLVRPGRAQLGAVGSLLTSHAWLRLGSGLGSGLGLGLVLGLRLGLGLELGKVFWLGFWSLRIALMPPMKTSKGTAGMVMISSSSVAGPLVAYG